MKFVNLLIMPALVAVSAQEQAIKFQNVEAVCVNQKGSIDMKEGVDADYINHKAETGKNTMISCEQVCRDTKKCTAYEFNQATTSCKIFNVIVIPKGGEDVKGVFCNKRVQDR